MDLQDELRSHLGDAAGAMQPTPADLTKVRATARRNHRRRVAGLGAVVVLGLGGAALGTAQLLDDSDADSTVVIAGPADEDETEASSTTVATTIPPTVGVSGPALSWSESALQAESGGDITWTGDRYITFRFEHSQPNETAELLSSTDGSEWSVVSALPEPGFPVMAGADGDHIAVFTIVEGGDGPSAPQAAKVWKSSDGGQTWTSLDPPTKLDAVATEYVQEGFSPVSLAVKGETIILSGDFFPNFNIPAILVDQGLASTEEEAMAVFPAYEFGSGSITFTIDDTPTTVSFEELGLTPDEAAIFDFAGPNGVVVRSSGDSFVEIPDLGGAFVRVIATTEGFMAADSGPRNDVQVSPDGVEWSPVSGPWTGSGEVFGGADVIAFVPHEDRSIGQVSRDGGATWTALQLPDGLVELAVGEAGFVAVTDSSFEDLPTDDFEGGDLVVEKDGYRVTFGMTVIVEDAASGEVIVEFDEEQSSADVPPEGVILDESTGDITFLDPESGEPLVTIGGDDMGFDVGASEMAVEPGTPPTMEVWFSTDGTDWTMVDLEEEFGFSGFARFAVGHDEVVGLLSAWFDDEHRIFVGRPGD